MNAKLRRIFSAIAIGLTAMLCVVGNAVPASAAPVSLTASDTKGEGKSDGGTVEGATKDSRESKAFWTPVVLYCRVNLKECLLVGSAVATGAGSLLSGVGAFFEGVGNGIAAVVSSVNNNGSKPSPSTRPSPKP